MRAETWPELLAERAQQTPDAPAITFLEDGERDARTLSFAELDRRARAIAARLRRTAGPQERVLLLLPPGLDFVAGFFGCLYAGQIAVPAPPPAKKRGLPRLLAMAADASPTVILTTRGTAAMLRSERDTLLAGLRSLAIEDVGEAEAADLTGDVRPESVAFLQYTSGSTGTPKGVVLTHENLLANERAIAAAFDHDRDSVVVGWLPPFHDMGLIGNLLQPIFLGARSVQMAPAHFLVKPLRWLRAISRYRATTSGGPNFAYELCLQKIAVAERAELDLRSWRVAFNGAEPVRAATLARFAEGFAGAGFESRAFYPCYGLAEATLLVSGGAPEALPLVASADADALEAGAVLLHDEATTTAARSRALVGSGVGCGAEVRIVDPTDKTVRENGRVGEIWVRGPSVARGYWQRKEESEQTFGALLASREGPFLRTGDLGALVDGELFVTGRSKDLLIVRGRNVYPQDIELASEQSHPALAGGGAAAFALDPEDGEPRVIVVQEVGARAADLEGVAEAMRRAIADQCEVAPHEIVLIKRASLPRTTSGKVQRRLTRQLLASEALAIVWRTCDRDRARAGELPKTQAERALAALVSEVLGRDGVMRDDGFVALGGDSLAAAQLSARIGAVMGVMVTPADVLEAATLAELANSLERDASEVGASTRVQAVERPARLPLSHAQERLWFLEQLAGGQPVYHVAGALRMRGTLDHAALERALGSVVGRHEALRTTFVSDAEGPTQRIHPAQPMALPVRDAAQAALGEAIAREVRAPFDLARAAVRWALFRVSDGEHWLVLCGHHLIVDGFSLRVLLEDLVRAYDAGCAAVEWAAPPLSLQPADHALWERTAAEQAWESSLAYHRERFALPVPPLALPTDRPRGAVQTYAGARAPFTLPSALVGRLRRLAREHDATLFTVLLAGLAVVLQRHGGEDDLCLGTPLVARPDPALDDVVGCFLNTLALRLDLSGNPDVRTLISRVRTSVLEAQRHAHVPFERVLSAVRPARDLARAPLFQAMISLQPARAQLSSATGVALEVEQLDTGTAQLDLSLDLTPYAGEDRLDAAFEYNTDLFAPATIARLAEHYVRALEALAEQPQRRLSELPIFGRDLPLVEPAEPRAPQLPVHLAFEIVAEVHAEREALVFGATRLSYAQVNARANRLARLLRRRGVAPETRVGLLLPCTPELVIAALAVLKAGGCYVPLDIAHPVERLRFVLADAGVACVVSSEEHATIAPSSIGQVLLDRDAAALTDERADDPAYAGDMQQLAYVLYTSGSTGQPKGVMVSHASVATTGHAYAAVYGAEGCAPRVLSLASPAFDVWTADWVRALTQGGTLIVAQRELTFDVLGMTQLMRREQVTVVDVVPAVAKLLGETWAREGQGVPSLALLIVGSDVCAVRDFEALRLRCAPRTRLLSCYGLTETTIDSTYHEGALDGDDAALHAVPLGRCFPGTRAFVVDRHAQLLPPGVPGELALSGVGLARGYQGQPARTALRFVPDPWSGEPGARLYLTGDRARLRDDGTLEFLGRSDAQVKVRGVRVEVGEVEACLRLHPAVRDVAVVLRERAAGSSALVAYVARAGETSGAALRAFAAARLPEVMVPEDVVVLAALPLSANGKIDRRALPPWSSDPQECDASRTTGVAASTSLERSLVALWSELLPGRAIGLHDNFFDLGGHSLLLAQAQGRLAVQLGREVPMLTLLQHPTVAALAAALEGAPAASGPEAAPAPRPERSERRRAEVLARRRRREESEP